MKNVIIFLLILIAIVGVSSATYFYIQSRQFDQTNDSDAAAVEAVVNKVSKLMELPEGEVPVLATVTDRDKISNQQFFARSENGDKVLLYTEYGRAILYRPSSNKIIDVTTINKTEETTTSSEENELTVLPTSRPTPSSVTVSILNSTDVPGLASQFESQIEQAVPNTSVTQTGNTAAPSYEVSVVINVSGKYPETARAIANELQTTLSNSLPSTESNPGTDILVILGEDAR